MEEADLPWSFPLIPVPKKNSREVRWAVDYRKLNAVTKKDAFPLPNIANNLSHLAGSRVFSALDGAGAFHAVPVQHADREKTVFSSPFGQYQFVWMPLGLANARPLTPASSQKLYDIYPPRKSSATWTTRLSILRIHGVTCVSYAKS